MDIQTRLRGISTYCSLHKALIHSLSDTCHREVHKCTLNSHFLHVYVILHRISQCRPIWCLVYTNINVYVEFKVTLHAQVRYRGTLQY